MSALDSSSGLRLSEKQQVALGLLRSASRTKVRPACLLELLSFAAGAKPCVRLVAEGAVSIYEAMVEEVVRPGGVSIARRWLQVRRREGWNEIMKDGDAGTPVEMVFLAWSSEAAERAADAERLDSTAAGLTFGYPACCVDRGISPLAHGADWGERLIASAAWPNKPIDHRVNRFAAEWGGIGTIGEMYPCSLRCEGAIRYSQDMLDAARSLGLSSLADRAVADARHPVVLDSTGRVRLAADGESGRIDFR